VIRPSDDRIRAAVEERLEAVEGLIPSRPPWRGAEDRDNRSNRIVVTAGPAIRQGPGNRSRWGMVVVGAATIMATVAYGAFGGFGGSTKAPGWADRFPIQTASTFEQPFTYAIDPDSRIEKDAGSSHLQQFRIRDTADSTRFTRIVAIRVIDLVRLEPCRTGEGAVTHLSSPQAFVDYLKAIPGLTVTAPVRSTVDGRPALQFDATQKPDGACASVNIWQGEGAFTDAAAARRIQAFDIDGTTILVVTAVAEASDLQAWEALADQFIATLHFVPPPSSSLLP
jgi:hypothetical protein